MKPLIWVMIFITFSFVNAQETPKKKTPVNTKQAGENAKPVKNTKTAPAKEIISPAKVSEEGDNKTSGDTKSIPASETNTTEESKTTEPKESVDTKTTEPTPEEIKSSESAVVVEEAKDNKPVIAPPAFKGPNLIHMPSAQPLQKDILNFIFNHRFGSAKAPIYDFLGLDKGANTQLSLDYGFTDKLSLGLSRMNAFKTYEVRSKYLLYQQTNSFPVTISLFGSVGVETEKQTVTMGPYINPPTTGYSAVDEVIKKKLNEYELSYSDRTSYLGSILISRRFGEIFSLQVSPIFVHRNFVKTSLSNDRLGLDIGGKIQINKSISFLFEMILTQKRDYIGDRYAAVDANGYGNINNLSSGEINSTYYKNSDLPYIYLRNVVYDKPVPYYSIPLSFGMSYESGGHIYNLFITNSRTLAHTQLLRGADFDYRNREWTVGFNINRFFSFAKEVSEDNF